MKLIFLDLDGVVATNRTYNVWKKAGCLETFDAYVSLIDPILLGQVDEMAIEVGGSIVVSSNWRYAHVCPYPVDDVLRSAGLTSPIVGHTPKLLSPPEPYEPGKAPRWPRKLRGYEIHSYILANKLDIEDIVILDDDTDASAAPDDAVIRQGSRVIYTSASEGMRPKHLARARKLLGIQQKPPLV